MKHVAGLALGYMIIWYLAGWLCHTIVYAGAFALLDRWHPRLLQRKRVDLEFWIAALAGLCAISIPVGWIWIGSGRIEIILALVIALVSIFMSYRRLREKAIEQEHARGDFLGYGLGLILWAILYVVSEKIP